MKNIRKQLIFVDDSGDPGFKHNSSNNFVMAAAFFVEAEASDSIMCEMNKYRQELGWQYNHEFKFTKNPKNIVIEILNRIKKYDFKIYAVYIEKKDFRETNPKYLSIFNRENSYDWMIKELLNDMPLQNAKITIDGRSSRQNMKNTKTYLRRKIHNSQMVIDIKFEDSVRTSLLQLADLIAGSINRSLQLDKTDSKVYLDIIRNKIVSLRKITLK